MRILFLDQSGNLGGAELCLADIAQHYHQNALVGLFAEGPFRQRLEQQQTPVQVLSQRSLQVRKESGWQQGLSSLGVLLPLIRQVSQLARQYDLIYANTQKALVVGAIASLLSRRPLVYHLHDIVSSDHFSAMNRRIIVTLANRFAVQVIANSEASRAAFEQAGGRSDRVTVIYNGFQPEAYQNAELARQPLRQALEVGDRFVIGHFSRLSPWKGQHVLIEALAHCPADVMVLLVGDALFGEQLYVEQLHQQVTALGLQDRVRFLGFRSDVPQLMAACDLIAHTSIAPEPLGRVIVEAMLCQRPVVAAAAGGALELIDHGQTGWLSPPDDARKLADVISTCYGDPVAAGAIAQQARQRAQQRFNLKGITQQIDQVLQPLV